MYTQPGRSICIHGRICLEELCEILKYVHTQIHSYSYAYEYAYDYKIYMFTYVFRERERGSSSNRLRMMPINSEMDDYTLIFE